MKSFFIFALAMVAVCCGDDGYTSDKDLDIAAVVNDLPTLTSFVDCFFEQAECNDQTAAFQIKKDFPEALQQACAKCTPAQKHTVRVFLDALKEKLPGKYEDFKKKYDADNKYFPNFEAAVAAF